MVSWQAALTAMIFSGAGETALLDFYADWCGPCRAMQRTIDALVEEGFPVRRVNIDRDPELAKQYGVRSVPCYVMVVEGQEVDRAIGGTTFTRLKRMCALATAGRSASQVLPGPVRGAAPEASSTAEPVVAIPAAGAPPLLSATTRQAAVVEPLPPKSQAVPSTDGTRNSNAWLPEGNGTSGPDAELIRATVRLRVADPQGHSYGSGTIIDAQGGEALVLTCGHLFRESKGRGAIEVDLFGPDAAKAIPARLIRYDLDRDLALLCIRTRGPVTSARVAPAGREVVEGSRTINVGCNNGDQPSARRSRVTGVNKVLGPPNFYVSGMPVEGRSGGGLFTEDGMLIGVCNAADPAYEEGFYAALDAVHALLDEAKLSFVYDAPKGNTARPGPGARLVAVDPPPMPKRMPKAPPRRGNPNLSEVSLGPAAAKQWSSSDPSARLTAGEQAALDEVCKRMKGGAEVLIVIRPKNDPRADSEIIVLQGGSENFLRRLAATAGPSDR